MSAPGLTTTAKSIARWDGTGWQSVGGGVPGGTLFALAEWSSPTGQVLVVGGAFTTVGPLSAAHLAIWDGVAWSTPIGTNGPVRALASYTQSGQSRLAVGGDFSSVLRGSSTPANKIASWNGTSWQQIGSGLPGVNVQALTLVDDIADGPHLVAGGVFGGAGGFAAKNIARWNGTAWKSLGSGANGAVQTLCAWPEGTSLGEALYAGGSFTQGGPAAANRIARWASDCGPGFPAPMASVIGEDDSSASGDLDGNGWVDAVDVRSLLSIWSGSDEDLLRLLRQLDAWGGSTGAE